MSKSITACVIKASMLFRLILANITILLCFFFFVLVILNNFFTIPVVKENTTVKEAPAMPTGIQYRDTILKVPKDADKIIKTLSA